MQKFAEFVLRFRAAILIAITVTTALLAGGLFDLRVGTNLSSLLPLDATFVRTQFNYEKLFGGVSQFRVMVVAESGSILTTEGLAKLARLHDAVDATPGINHDQVLSIVSRKVRTVRVDEYGVTAEPLIDRNKPLPSTEAELRTLRSRAALSPGVAGQLLAVDDSAAIIQGTLIEGTYDIPAVFAHLQRLATAESGSGFSVHLLGDPVLSGWVFTYNTSTFLILGLSIVLLLICLYWFSRSVPIVMLSVIGSVISAVWGAGLAGYLGYAMDPMVLVIPMLIAARTLSHSAQMGIRYIELMHEGVKPYDAAVALIKKQFNPGTIGILADAVAIFVLASSRIPLIHQLAIFAGMWCISAIFSVMFLGPILASYMPDRSDLYAEAEQRVSFAEQHHRFLNLIALMGLNPKFRASVWVLVVLSCFAGLYGAWAVPLGDVEPGTSILKADSPFNIADRELRTRFRASEELVIVAEPKPGTDVRALETLAAIAELRERVADLPSVQGTLAFDGLLPSVRRLMSANHPKFELPPRNQEEAGMLTELLMAGSAPGDFDRFFAGDFGSASIRIFVADRLQSTLKKVIPAVTAVVDELNQRPGTTVHLRMAMGSAALQDATNHEVEYSHYVTWALAILTIAVSCYIGFRSWVAVGVLMIPLMITNLCTMAVMTAMDIGLTVNTLPIGVVGMGVGIDYGIYLLYRIIEERKARRNETLENVIRRALYTSGRAIYFTAFTMTLTMSLWPLIAQLHYQAVIGLLLAVVLIVNFFGAMILIPLLLITFKPHFLDVPTQHAPGTEPTLDDKNPLALST